MSKAFKSITSNIIKANSAKLNKGELIYVQRGNLSTTSSLFARQSSSKEDRARNNVEVDWEADGKEFEFNFDDHTTPAHRFIRQIRYVRHYLRKAKYELPKLKDLSKPFVPPTDTQYVQFLKVEHLGEEHPLDNKSTLLINLEKLIKSKVFNDAQVHKLLLICSDHHFENSNQLRFSSNKYPSYDENRLALVNLWERIIKEVKEGEDLFSDIPLPQKKPNSTHNRLSKEQLTFPMEWVQKQ